MKTEIIEKLKKYSDQVPKEESDVVYFIVQVGKIIESQKMEKDFPVLWFYRNWVVHYQLDKRVKDGRTVMLDKLNQAALSMSSGDGNEFNLRFGEAISFDHLNNEIVKFCTSNDLAIPKQVDAVWLKEFNRFLLRILIDLPLLPPNDARYVFEEFRFNRPIDSTHDFECVVKLIPGRVIRGGKGIVKVNVQAKLD